MATKSTFMAFRAEPEQQQRIKVLASRLGRDGNLSAALRWLVDNAPGEPGPQVGAELAGAGQQAEGEASHA